MKTINSLLTTLLLTASVFITQQATAQAPQKMSYQSVLRNSSNALLVSTPVGIRISVLQNSATGPAVYVETQTATTNGSGLVSIKIGNGTATTGTFAGINWANASYFIKTETDPAGGTNYTITGTQEILTVPYAMYAAKSGDSTTLGAIGGSSSTKGATITSGVLSLTPADATNGGIVTTGAQTFAGNKTFSSEIKITAGTPGAGKVLTSDASGLASWKSSSPCGYAIGQNVTELGGIIFYLDASGCHGLVCAPTDQSAGIRQRVGIVNGHYADCVGGGYSNTYSIVGEIGGAGAGAYAAYLTAGYTGGNSTKLWYLPSKYELNLMYKNIGQGNVLGLGNVGGFANDIYWSSTDYTGGSFYSQNFSNGGQLGMSQFQTYYVRAVRAF